MIALLAIGSDNRRRSWSVFARLPATCRLFLGPMGTPTLNRNCLTCICGED